MIDRAEATGRCGIPAFAALAIVEGDGRVRGAWSEEEQILGPTVAASRRGAFRLGRQAAHQALRQLGLDSGPILKEEEGQPRWPVGAVGSIANKPSVAAALAAPVDEVIGLGIDLEFLRPVAEIESVVLRPEEASWISDIRGEDRDKWVRDKAVISVFAAKEAIFKALFPIVRRRFGFDAATLEPRENGFEARLVEDLHPMYPRHSRLYVRTCWVADRVLCWVVIPRESGAGVEHAANL